jgi:hypothetical protein
VLICCLAFTASAVQGAGPAWNQYAAQFNFASYPQSEGTRFVDAYSGSNFAADFAGILARVSQAMSSQNPGADGEDKMNATLDNWPSGGGI